MFRNINKQILKIENKLTAFVTNVFGEINHKLFQTLVTISLFSTIMSGVVFFQIVPSIVPVIDPLTSQLTSLVNDFNDNLSASATPTCQATFTYNLNTGQCEKFVAKVAGLCPSGYVDTANGTAAPCITTQAPNGCSDSANNPPACDNCPSTNYFNEITVSCAPCPAGSYCPGGLDNTGNPNPKVICPINAYCTVLVSTPTNCLAGQLAPSGSTSLAACTYPACTNGANNPPSCNSCPSGMYYNSSLAIPGCVSCTGGYTCAGGLTGVTPNAPVICPANTYCQSGSSTATPCPTGKISPAGSGSLSNCVLPPCPNGANNPNTCNSCPAGQFLNNSNTCSPCQQGYYCPGGLDNSNNSVQPIICPLGNICPANVSAPNPCATNQTAPVGSYLPSQCVPSPCNNDTNNPPACNQCTIGREIVAGFCRPCPINTYCPSGTTTNPITCPAGKFSPQGSSSINFCTSNIFSFNKSNSFNGTMSESINAPSGSTIDVRLDYDNTGNQSMTDAQIKDNLPAGFTYVPGSLKNCITPSATESLCDGQSSANKDIIFNNLINNGVAPTAGLYDFGANDQSGFLLFGKKRYLQGGKCNESPNPSDVLTTVFDNDPNPALTNFSCSSSTGITNSYLETNFTIDSFGKRYMQNVDCSILGVLDSYVTTFNNISTANSTNTNCNLVSGSLFSSKSVDTLNKRFLQIDVCYITAPFFWGDFGAFTQDNIAIGNTLNQDCITTKGPTYQLGFRNSNDILDTSRAKGYITYQIKTPYTSGTYGTTATLRSSTQTGSNPITTPIDDLFVTGVSNSINITYTPPDTTILSGPASTTNSNSAAFTFNSTVNGIATYQCSLDGGSYSSCTSPSSYTGLLPGSHNFFVRAIDGNGNSDLSPANYNWIIDQSMPDTAIVGKPSATTAQHTATFTFTSTKPSPGSFFNCKLDNGLYVICSTPKSYSNLAVGSHTFSVVATDTFGNTDTTPATYTWLIDNSCPTGQYLDYTNPAAPLCKSCPAGSYCPGGVDIFGNPILPTACPAGTYTLTGATTCSQCPVNTYCPGTGNATPTACPAGKISPSGSTIATDCYFPACTNGATNQPTCNSCPVGFYYNSGITSCATCPAGAICLGGLTTGNSPIGFTICLGGTYANTGLTPPVCSTCPVNTFCAGSGNTAPTACPSGKISPAGSTLATDCYFPACTNGATNQPTCNSCPVGNYFNTGSTSCVACPSGAICLGGLNSGNPVGFTTCTAGTYANTGIIPPACTPCPVNTFCAGSGNTAPTACPAGQIAPSGSTLATQCYAPVCANGAIIAPACNVCPATQYLNTVSGNCTGNPSFGNIDPASFGGSGNISGLVSTPFPSFALIGSNLPSGTPATLTLPKIGIAANAVVCNSSSVSSSSASSSTLSSSLSTSSSSSSSTSASSLASSSSVTGSSTSNTNSSSSSSSITTCSPLNVLYNTITGSIVGGVFQPNSGQSIPYDSILGLSSLLNSGVLTAGPISGGGVVPNLTIPTNFMANSDGGGFIKITNSSSSSSIDPFKDSDGDSVPDNIEKDGPNNGDGNGDGIPDYLQSNVITLKSHNTLNEENGFITTEINSSESEGSCILPKNISNVIESNQSAQDEQYLYPFGLMSVKIECENINALPPYSPTKSILGKTNLKFFWHGIKNWDESSYRKFGTKTSGDQKTLSWFGFGEKTNSKINIPIELKYQMVGNIFTPIASYQIIDGVLGDDTIRDGVLFDPAGPGIKVTKAQVVTEQILNLARTGGLSSTLGVSNTFTNNLFLTLLGAISLTVIFTWSKRKLAWQFKNNHFDYIQGTKEIKHSIMQYFDHSSTKVNNQESYQSSPSINLSWLDQINRLFKNSQQQQFQKLDQNSLETKNDLIGRLFEEKNNHTKLNQSLITIRQNTIPLLVQDAPKPTNIFIQKIETKINKPLIEASIVTNPSNREFSLIKKSSIISSPVLSKESSLKLDQKIISTKQNSTIETWDKKHAKLQINTISKLTLGLPKNPTRIEPVQ